MGNHQSTARQLAACKKTGRRVRDQRRLAAPVHQKTELDSMAGRCSKRTRSTRQVIFNSRLRCQPLSPVHLYFNGPWLYLLDDRSSVDQPTTTERSTSCAAWRHWCVGLQTRPGGTRVKGCQTVNLGRANPPYEMTGRRGGILSQGLNDLQCWCW